jgi:starch phosphorylase
VQEIEALRNGYDPMALIGGDVDLARIMELIEQGVFNGVESNATDAVLHAIKNPHDQWMTAADFRSFVDAQQRASAAYQQLERWTRMSILNTAASGRFSTDRTMRDYNRDIWHLSPVCV